ncbi:MAG: hypothetical protein VYE18_06955 [Pseudomonadota bacterium]|nr:hypothetical protein [Pseudomonadota bacterium]
MITEKSPAGGTGDRRGINAGIQIIDGRIAERRIGADPRQGHGSILKIAGSLVKLNQCLDNNTAGERHIGIERVDEDRKSKTI